MKYHNIRFSAEWRIVSNADVLTHFQKGAVKFVDVVVRRKNGKTPFDALLAKYEGGFLIEANSSFSSSKIFHSGRRESTHWILLFSGDLARI